MIPDPRPICKTTLKNRERVEYIPEFCYSATIDEIRNKDWSLVPSKYIEFVDRDLSIDFQSEMGRIQIEMQSIMDEERHSQDVLRAAFEGIGYGIK